MLQFRVISIGTLAFNPLWGERGPTREGHATTTLIEAGDRKIIVDPSLPGNILLPRMQSRTSIKPSEITDVFLTSKDPAHYRGITLFPGAQWWMASSDREVLAAVGQEVAEMSQLDADEAGDARARGVMEFVQTSLEVSRRVSDAPDSLAKGVDLFPLPGVTPGTTGLLLALPSTTVLVTGDAITTQDHLAQGRIISPCEDLERAQESFREAIEIADILVLGRDNAVLNPMRSAMGQVLRQDDE